MNRELRKRLHLEYELQQALERDELYLNFQPKVVLDSGALHSVEALVRWNHPQQGLLPPLQFISLAEERGLIVPLSRWVLNAACRQIQAWREQGQTELTVAVNISSWEFVQQDLVKLVRETLAQYDLPGTVLELELTESVLMAEIGKNERDVIAILHDLKALGVSLALDDFGTGYSSLAYLKQFPVDLLKIDRFFVRNIIEDADDAALVRAIIDLAHNLRLKVIAEGIETEAQRTFLQQQGCDYGQGNLFSPAVAPEVLERWWSDSLEEAASETVP
jgi:EAL domain-containing protein (putative c-di-GMP-specific phosphodiesterase class I)